MSLSEALIVLPLPQVVALKVLFFLTTKISGGLPALSLRKDKKTQVSPQCSLIDGEFMRGDPRTQWYSCPS